MAVRPLVGGALRTAESLLGGAWRRGVIARGRDRTTEHTHRSALVLAPHPDDETLGCGAAIARKRAAGTAVRVLVAADGSSSHRSAVIGTGELVRLRSQELIDACRILGVATRDIVHLGVPDEEVAAQHQLLVDVIHEELEGHHPQDLLVVARHDWHPDHRALNRAAHDAARRSSWRVRLLEYPVWWWVEGPWRRHEPRKGVRRVTSLATAPLGALTGPRAELVTTAGFLDVKRRALAAHRTQVERMTDEPSWAVLDESFRSTLLGPVEVFFPAGPPP